MSCKGPARRQNGPRSGAHLGTSAATARSAKAGYCSRSPSIADEHNAVLPAVYAYRLNAKLGGLLSYGFDTHNNFRRAAMYVDRILKGEKAGDLPVQAQDKFELAINLRTAKVLGLYRAAVAARHRRRGDRMRPQFCCGARVRRVAPFCRANRAEQCRLLAVDRPTYARCEIFAF